MVGRQLVLWFVVVVLAALQVTDVSSAEGKIVIKNVARCPGHNTPFRFQMEVENKLNGSFILKTNVTNVKVFSKLLESSKFAMGEIHAPKIKDYPDFCEDVTGEGHIWSDIMRHTEPRLPAKCPMLKGNYFVKGSPNNIASYIPKDGLTKGNGTFELHFTYTKTADKKDDGKEDDNEAADGDDDEDEIEIGCIRYKFVYEE